PRLGWRVPAPAPRMGSGPDRHPLARTPGLAAVPLPRIPPPVSPPGAGRPAPRGRPSLSPGGPRWERRESLLWRLAPVTARATPGSLQGPARARWAAAPVPVRRPGARPDAPADRAPYLAHWLPPPSAAWPGRYVRLAAPVGPLSA